MKILVINCGSSSLKFQLIDSETEAVIAKGLCERIGIEGSKLIYTPTGGEKQEIEEPMEDHKKAVSLVIDALTDKETGVLTSLSEINAVGHRLVHGGEKFASSTLINEEVIAAITEYLYGIPYEYYEKYRIRRYGFHGTSHSYVSKRAAEMLGKDYTDAKIIVCHLGNGASVSAVKNGKCVDTSMGLTPLEGLMMGTRSGDIDPAIIEFLAHKEGLSIDDIMSILNKKSGMYGLSGYLSSDSRDLHAACDAGKPEGIRTVKTYCYRVAKYIGAYAAAMNGVDAICFTAGIGENSAETRAAVCEYLGYLGIGIDEEQNKKRGEDVVISTPDSKVKVMVIPTNEELAIARETAALV